MIKYPIKIPAIRIEQPLGVFYVTSLTAECLLETCYTIKAEILDDDDDSTIGHLDTFVNKLIGNQRVRTPKRLNEIKRYTETVDASFPNSIILGANYDQKGNLVTSPEERWTVEVVGEGFYNLIIPTAKKLASIIDGQHRVFGFQNSSAKNMELLCSVFIDLPLPYHARIFTNINMNQKRVDKNLAYNLFQFDMEQGEPSTWTPETLAVYFTRVLAEDENSPLRGMIKLGLVNSTSKTSISMASIIDGILSLITSNPKNDRELMHSKSLKDGRSREIVKLESLNSPLRALFINNKDKTLYDFIYNYFLALKCTLWRHSVFTKTLGIHACFDFLRIVSQSYEDDIEYDENYFINLLSTAKNIDFDNEFFGIQSKLRGRLKNILLICSGVKDISQLSLKDEDISTYIALTKIRVCK